MEPVSIGIAAAVLLASKFGESFAQDAGESGWNAVKRLQAVIAAKFRGDAETESAITALVEAPTEDRQSEVATRITSAVRADDVFGAELERLVALARQDNVVSGFLAQAYDHAKQLNIRGDNFGQINL
ncbi:hypothetical protein [Nocardia gipuzkoensis]